MILVCVIIQGRGSFHMVLVRKKVRKTEGCCNL